MYVSISYQINRSIITPTHSFSCPDCNSDFLEEIDDPVDENNPIPDGLFPILHRLSEAGTQDNHDEILLLLQREFLQMFPRANAPQSPSSLLTPPLIHDASNEQPTSSIFTRNAGAQSIVTVLNQPEGVNRTIAPNMPFDLSSVLHSLFAAHLPGGLAGNPGDCRCWLLLMWLQMLWERWESTM